MKPCLFQYSEIDLSRLQGHLVFGRAFDPKVVPPADFVVVETAHALSLHYY